MGDVDSAQFSDGVYIGGTTSSIHIKQMKILQAIAATVVISGLAISPMPAEASGATCWFQMSRGAKMMQPHNCRAHERINNNGHRVYDVIEQNGLTRSIVLWDNKTVEVILNGRVYPGSWGIDRDRDVQITVQGGTFAFRLPSHIRNIDSPTTSQAGYGRPTHGQTMSDTPIYWKR